MVEDTEMTVDELATCVADAGGNKNKIKKCEDDFVAAGGTASASEGGKVFSDPNGGKVFVTDGGKVFDNRA
jgi:hypothetical protein